MGLTHKDVTTILELIERMGCDEIRLELEDLKIEVRRSVPGGGSPRDMVRTSTRRLEPPPGRPALDQPLNEIAAEVSMDPEAIPEDCIAIRSSIVGTFYRAPSPEQAVFVEVGSIVTPKDSIGLVEVMKLFHTIHAEVAGTIVEIRAVNGALVEFGQVLMVLRPSKERTLA